MAGPESFENYDLFSQYLPMGRNYGNPLMNMVMPMLLGHNAIPEVQNGQSVYDTFLQRERSRQFMQLQGSSFANSMLFNKMGVGGVGAFSAIGSMIASPDSGIARMMSPLVGGNPMAASMGLYAGLTGANVMGNFGRMSSVTGRETEDIMQSMVKNFYSEQAYTGPGGAQQEIRKNINDRLLKYTETDEGRRYLQDLGVDPQNKEAIANLDITAGSGTQEERAIQRRIAAKQVTSSDRLREFETFLSSKDGNISDTLDKTLKEQIKDTLGDAKDKIKDYMQKGGEKLDPSKIRKAIADNKLKPDDIKAGIGKIADLDELEKEYKRTEGYQKAGSRITGFDFAKSRGFKIEDITSGFAKAADLRMLGNNKNQSVAQSMSAFSENAGGAMSAARSVFGNLSGDQLVTKMSDLMGSSAADLSTKTGAGDIEKLLRDVKSVGRVAGVSIKTMLGIIDSAKQLAANNPQLQYLNSSAITTMALKSVKNAASMGMVMSAEDYRKAGGAQGIAARDIEESQAFLQSPLGGAGAAILARAKGTSAYEGIKKMFMEGGLTGQELDSGGMAKIADMMSKAEGKNISVADVASVMSNTLMQQNALKDKDIAETLNESKDVSISKSFFDMLPGLNQEKLEDEFKKSFEGGESFQQFSLRRLQPELVSEQQRAFYATHSQGIQRSFLDSTRTPEQRAAMDALVKQQTEDETRLSAKMDAKQAPVITQVVDALMKGQKVTGYDTAQAASGMANIFATDDRRGRAANEAALKAREAGSTILEMMGDKNISSMDLQGGKVVTAINALTAGRRSNIEASGGTVAKGELKDVSEKELTQLANDFKTLNVNSSAEAKERLDKLEFLNLNGGLDEYEQRHLNALRTANKIKSLDSDKAVKMLNKGTIKGVEGAVIQATTDESVKAALEAEKTNIAKDTGERLQLQSKEQNSDDIKAAEVFYKNKGLEGKSAYTEISRDFMNREGFFATDEYKKKYSTGKLAATLEQGAEKYRQREEQLQATGEGSSPEQQNQKALVDAMEKLASSITGGGRIGEVIDKLATALR